MSLRKDIENAFLKTMEYDNIEDRDARKKMKEKAEDLGVDISRAVVDFLQKQELTITKMKAIVKLDELTTTGPLSANIRPSVQTMIPAGIFATTALIPNPPVPVPVSGITARNGVDIPKLRLKTGGGQGGSMNAVGYAYVGKKNPVSPNESNEDKTVVQLLDVVDD
tara:strand:- start:508 stop:1005 length:498 start_codon:yes stop_codon:yes gene_type:complete